MDYYYNTKGSIGEIDEYIIKWIKVNLYHPEILNIIEYYKRYGGINYLGKAFFNSMSLELKDSELQKLINLNHYMSGKFNNIQEFILNWIDYNIKGSHVLNIVQVYKEFTGVYPFNKMLSSSKSAKKIKSIITLNDDMNESFENIEKKIFEWITSNLYNHNIVDILKIYENFNEKHFFSKIIVSKLCYRDLKRIIALNHEISSDFGNIDELVFRWINMNLDNPQLLSIIKLYKEYSGNNSLDNIVLNAVLQNTAREDIFEFINLYLNWGGKFSLIEFKILEWINSSSNNSDLVNFIEIYISNNGNKDNILTWVNNNLSHEEILDIKDLLKLWKYI